MARSRASITGPFKTRVSDEFTGDDAKTLATYFGLPPQKYDRINRSENPGLTLLDILEDDEKIGGDKGVDDLCEALQFCSLNRIERIVREEYDALRNEKPTDLINPSQGPVDMKQLKSILQDELRKQDCYEVAMYLNLPPKAIEQIRNSVNYAEELVERLHDRHLIQESSIDMLIVALNDRGLKRIVTLVSKMAPGEAFRDMNTAVKAERERCLCGGNSFDELRSFDDSEVLSLVCTDENCSAEWLIPTDVLTETDSSESGISLLRGTGRYAHKPPHKINISSIKHEIVTNIDSLRPGDHLVMRRWRGLYDHHAIFISKKAINKMELIHWSSNLKFFSWLWRPVASIQWGEEPFPGSIRRVHYGTEDPPGHVIARAKYLYYDKSQNYSVTANNCETLATYCKLGERYSIQGELVDDIIPPFLPGRKKAKKLYETSSK